MRHKYLWVGSIIGMVLALDQFTKHLVEKRMRMYEVVPVIRGFFNLTRVRNKGAAFSLLSTAPDGFRGAFFISVSLVAVIVIAIMIRKANDRLLVVSFSLISAGAMGNLVDRVRFGEVVDFIQWYVGSWYWPSFNVADSAITVGVALLVIDMVFGTSTKSQISNPK
ncbi:MAG TPA: signal peptidase II [Nitrospirota bacterium]|nr:signal peptidase II [Nitrospirota bacterium]